MFRRDEVDVAERSVLWAPWSPAQLVALVIGIIYLVLGVAVLAKAGLSADTFTSAHVSVFGFGHTPLMGLIELVYGLLLIMAGAVPGAGRGLMAFLGALALGFGVVVLVQQASLYGSLGVLDANGWLYVITGVITLIAGVAAPIIFTGGRQRVAHDRDVIQRPLR